MKRRLRGFGNVESEKNVVRGSCFVIRDSRFGNTFLSIVIILGVCFFSSDSLAQKKKHKKNSSDQATLDTLNALVKRGEWQFPIRKMFDDALAASQKSHRPIVAFNIDYTVGSGSKYVADTLLRNPEVMIYLTRNFELAVHDYSVDPPPSVGLDSMRNLGHRLDQLERGYNIISRPTAIIINTDGSEIERIPNLETYSPEKFIRTVKDFLTRKNTVESLRKAFWLDPQNIEKHKAYLERMMTRFDYDSIIYHLNLVATDSYFGTTPDIRKEAAAQYAYLRFKQEGNIVVLQNWLATLDRHADSSIILAGLHDILEYYQSRKKIDSVAEAYQHIFSFTGKREPDLLNNYAWDLANYSKMWDSAIVIIDEAIARDGWDANYYDTRALVNYQKKDYEAALRDAKIALRYSKEDKQYFKDRVEFYQKERKRVSEEGARSPSKQ